jgi:hypothetical protein
MYAGMGLGAAHCCGDGQSACWLQITREGATHSLASTHDEPANPAADSSEQHTFPFGQSFGPSQVIGAAQYRVHVPSVPKLVNVGQQGAIPAQDRRPQDTLAPAAIADRVQLGFVAE